MLGRMALRITAIEALKGNTLVGAEVRDSEIGSIDVGSDGELRIDSDRPFISLYVEEAKAEGAFQPRDLHRSGETQFVLEIGIATAMVETNEDGESIIVGIGLPPTDAAFEFYLDMVGRQAVNALMDPANAWAELWRSLSSSIRKIERKRTADAATGTRIAAHQIVVTLDLLPDPPYGADLAPTSVWARLFAAMDAAGHPFAGQIKQLVIAGDEGESEGAARMRRFGLTLDEARALLAAQNAAGGEVIIQSVGLDGDAVP